jgi:hypothetical protein
MMPASHTEGPGTVEDLSEVQARESRRRQLSRMSKFALAQMCRTGITRRRDGGLSYVEGGYAPVIQWTKEEIIQAVLDAEFG